MHRAGGLALGSMRIFSYRNSLVESKGYAFLVNIRHIFWPHAFLQSF